ncbi:hypothetical protein Q9L58_001958 [Maublancomyces gigas]|uniref:Uncharacterized protein n=1 Tax=Discina gigas TaxID=1032678 RepID=A0ABR3GT25_9PEZI
MDAYTLIGVQKPPTRAALLLSDIKPLNAYIIASTGIPAYQIGESFPSSCLIGGTLPSATVTRASAKTALSSHLQECATFRDVALRTIQLHATDICDHPTAGEEVAKFGSSMFDILHDDTPNLNLKAVADLAVKSVVDSVMSLADERITKWEACNVSLQLFKDGLEKMPDILQTLTKGLPIPSEFNDLVENRASAIGAIDLIQNTVLAMIDRVRAIQKVFLFLVQDGKQNHENTNIVMLCGVGIWTELYTAAKDIRDGLYQ